MAITVDPISRRRFLRRVGVGGLALFASRAFLAPGSIQKSRRVDPNRFALLSDLHISGDTTQICRGHNMFDNLSRACAEILSADALPSAFLINGDCAFETGLARDYEAFVCGIAPLNAAGITGHIGLGNHDHRDRLLSAVHNDAARDTKLRDKQALIIRSKHAKWIMLDSLNVSGEISGELGEQQLDWLAGVLDADRDTPTLVMMHQNLELQEWWKSWALNDTARLLPLLCARKQVKALIYGHTHEWRHEVHQGLNLINISAVSYPFDPAEPHGWVEATLSKHIASFELKSLDKSHPKNGEKFEVLL